MNRFFKYFALSLFVAIVGCSKSDNEATGDLPGEGTITLALKSTVDGDAAKEDSTSYAYGSNISEYAVEIYRGEELYTSWSSFDKMTNPFTIASGDYSMRIYWGPNKPFAFGIPYYEGVSDFSVVRGENSDINITTALANTKLKVNFSERMAELYDDYWVEAATHYMVKDSVASPAKYTKDETLTGYFRSAPITAYLMLIYKGETQVRYFKLKDIDAQPQESYTLDIVPSISDGAIDVTIDESVNNRSESLNLPISSLFYDIHITTPTATSSLIAARGQQSLTSAKLTIDPVACELLSLESSYEFIGISDEQITALKEIGIEPLYTDDDHRISVWLTEMLSKLPAGKYTFEFTVEDIKPQIATQQFTVEIK